MIDLCNSMLQQINTLHYIIYMCGVASAAFGDSATERALGSIPRKKISSPHPVFYLVTIGRKQQILPSLCVYVCTVQTTKSSTSRPDALFDWSTSAFTK